MPINLSQFYLSRLDLMTLQTLQALQTRIGLCSMNLWEQHYLGKKQLQAGQFKPLVIAMGINGELII